MILGCPFGQPNGKWPFILPQTGMYITSRSPCPPNVLPLLWQTDNWSAQRATKYNVLVAQTGNQLIQIVYYTEYWEPRIQRWAKTMGGFVVGLCRLKYWELRPTGPDYYYRASPATCGQLASEVIHQWSSRPKITGISSWPIGSTTAASIINWQVPG